MVKIVNALGGSIAVKIDNVKCDIIIMTFHFTMDSNIN